MDEKLKQTITIKDRNLLLADGVVDIEGFANDYMIINTKYGKLNVEGNNLKINDLVQNEGKITVRGEISGIFFKDETGTKGFFKKAFK